MLIRYALEINPVWKAHARYALEILFEGMGVPTRYVENVSDADLVYSNECPPALAEKAVWIRADNVSDWNNPTAQVSIVEGMPFLYQAVAPVNSRRENGDLAGDVVYSTYTLTTGAFERRQNKDAWGVPLSKGSFLESASFLQTPAVAIYSDYLADCLRQKRGGELKQIPRWPEGKKYAVVLSHDVDGPFSSPRIGFRFRQLRSSLVRGDWPRCVTCVKEIAKSPLKAVLKPIPLPHDDPNFCFDQWMEFENSLSAKSCFYVAVTSSGDIQGAAADVEYDFRNPAMVNMLRTAIDDGFEVGLHASINAKEEASRFAAEKELLESKLDGYKIKGLRHHYWAMDKVVPERTLWSHHQAGFRYDTSLGLNDAPGFRRSMVWPFYPFDSERAEVTPILEIPPTLMDGGVFYNGSVQEDDLRRTIREHLKLVERYGGAVVLDWHVEQLNPARFHGVGPALTRVLADLSGDSDIFWASPAQLADWWNIRRQKLLA